MVEEMVGPKRSFWKDAAVGGGIVGLMVSLRMCLTPVEMSPVADNILSVSELVALVVMVYWLAKKRAAKYAGSGYTFGQGVGYVLAMMLFAGFLFGVAIYVLIHASPTAYDAVFEAAVRSSGVAGEEAAGYGMSVERMFDSVPMWIFVGIVIMEFYGGMVGLFVSPFVKRAPEADDEKNE